MACMSIATKILAHAVTMKLLKKKKGGKIHNMMKKDTQRQD